MAGAARALAGACLAICILQVLPERMPLRRVCAPAAAQEANERAVRESNLSAQHGPSRRLSTGGDNICEADATTREQLAEANGVKYHRGDNVPLYANKVEGPPGGAALAA